MTVTEMAAHAARAEQEVLAALDRLAGDDRAVVVDSPPGAGKTTLVVRAAVTIAAAGEPVMVVAQTNEQVDDLVCRIAEAAPSLAGALVATGLDDLRSCAVTVATAAKWALTRDGSWPWAIVDEAYQMRSDML